MDVHLVVAVWCGVFDHAKAFTDPEQAKAYAKKLKKASPNSMNYDVTQAQISVE